MLRMSWLEQTKIYANIKMERFTLYATRCKLLYWKCKKYLAYSHLNTDPHSSELLFDYGKLIRNVLVFQVLVLMDKSTSKMW